jgi:PA14 domain
MLLEANVKRLLFYLTLVLVLILGACAQPPQPTDPETPDDLSATAFGGTGLTGLYFNNMDFTGTTATRVDTSISKAWTGTGSPISGIAGTTYSIRWTGQVVPSYSEEYTFYLTHTDGARLMVNGQVLVNNWKDQAQVVDSGKVTLQAGVKYDIRLEYYRNATNPGQIKMEWQSARRARQVVPKDNLFPTGSNLQAALSALQNQPALSASNISLTTTAAVGKLTGTTDYFIAIPESNSNGYVEAFVDLSSQKVMRFFRYTLSTDRVDIRNLTNGLSTTISPVSYYFNSDRTIKPERKQELEKKYALLFFDQATVDFIYTPSAPANLLTPQGVVGVCSDCNAQKDKLLAGLGVTVSQGYANLTTTLLVPGPGGITEVIVTVANGVKDKYGVDEKIYEVDPTSIMKNLMDDYKKCVFQSQNCKPEIVRQNVTPTNPRIKINESVDLSLGFANKADAKWSLDYTVIISNVTGGVTFQIVSGGSGSLSPGQVTTVPIKAICPNYGTNGSATAVITNTTTGQVVNVALNVSCGTPKISDPWPNPLSIVGLAGQTVPSNISFSNIGDGILTYSTNLGFFNVISNVRITGGASGNVEPRRNASVTVTITCPNQAASDSGSLYISSNDPLRPIVVGTVKVLCLAGNVSSAETVIGNGTYCINDCGTISGGGVGGLPNGVIVFYTPGVRSVLGNQIYVGEVRQSPVFTTYAAAHASEDADKESTMPGLLDKALNDYIANVLQPNQCLANPRFDAIDNIQYLATVFTFTGTTPPSRPYCSQ